MYTEHQPRKATKTYVALLRLHQLFKDENTMKKQLQKSG